MMFVQQCTVKIQKNSRRKPNIILRSAQKVDNDIDFISIRQI